MLNYSAPSSFKIWSTLLAISTLILWCGITSADDWPQFRGLGGNATSADSTPTKWSATENIAWKTNIPGRGSSSPIVIGNKIFLTSFSGYGMSDEEPGDRSKLRLHTICFDRESGELIWEKSIPASSNEQAFRKRVVDHGFASGTPSSDGQAVYSYFGTSGAVAYDLEGNQLWHNGKLGTKTAGFGSASSPVEHGNLVYINASIECNTLFALSKVTGEVIWKKEDIMKSWSSPCLAKNEDGEVELVINQKQKIFGLNPKTGEELWTCEGIPDYVVPVPISESGIIYCLGGRSNRAMAIKLGGKGDVTETHKLWETSIGANVTSPVLFKDHLYWASDKGVANCMDAKTGKSVYKKRMPTKARVYASIVRGGENLFLTTRDKGVWVLSADPTFKEISLNEIESDKGMFNASPAISNGQLLIRSDDFLYCIGKKSSNEK